MCDDRASFDPIAYINTPRWSHSSLGLDRITKLLELLGNPQSNLKFIHVAGTNGKGSTCSYIASVLQCKGLDVGLFTSPFIECFEERIQINGRNIDMDSLIDVTLEVRKAAAQVEDCGLEHPTEFELMCAVAFLFFYRRSCDVVVLEVGLGGRLDSTNVISPLVSVITEIGLDHTDILGDSIEKIAYEKAGIIKSGVPVVTSCQNRAALKVIGDVAESMASPLFIVDRKNLCIGNVDPFSGVRGFTYEGICYTTSLLGIYQPINAATAIETCRLLSGCFGIDNETLQAGIAHATWPARFEVLGKSPLFVVDGAHNPQGAEALYDSISDLLATRKVSCKTAASENREITFVVGVLEDKDYEEMLRPFLSAATRWITYTPDNRRALSSDCLKRSIERCYELSEDRGDDIEVISGNSARQAVRLALEKTSPEGFVFAFGTLYSISDIKSAYRESEKYRAME